MRPRARVVAAAVLVLLAVVTRVGAAPRGGASPTHPHHDEWDFLNLINRERREAGLGPVAMITAARDVARNWSSTMAAEDLLRHNPDVVTQLKLAYPGYRRMGENVGVGGSVPTLHRAFMNSTGHRANILGDFSYAGVGVRWAGTKLWVTVNFLKNDAPLPHLTRVPLTRVNAPTDADASVQLSRRLAAGSAPAVVVARVDDFADALAAGPLAAVNRAPILLTRPDVLADGILDEARRVVAPSGRLFLMGGPNAISPGIEAAFVQGGMRVVRIAGPDRFGTAVATAPHVNAAPGEVVLVSGVSFPDAVVAGAAAGARKTPILLVGPTTLPAATRSYLLARPTAKRIVIGGPAVVSESVATEAGATERLAGPDRYATSVAVATSYFPGANRIGLAPGTRFQDAILGGAEAGRDGYPVLLTASPPTNATYDHVGAQAGRWVFALAVGRSADLTEDTLVTLLS